MSILAIKKTSKIKKKVNQSVSVMITFTPEQKKLVENYASEIGLSMASFIRSQALKEVTYQIPSSFKNENKSNKFAKFAGVLDGETSAKMIQDVYENRVNKN
jgi:hypothetical protein